MKKLYPVYSAKSAIKDFNDKSSKFQEMMRRLRVPEEKKMPLNVPTLDDHMRSQGLPTKLSHKLALARQVGMHDYSASEDNDRALLMAVQSMEGGSNAKNDKQREMEAADREYKLKERELDYKHKEIESRKQPTSDDIAQSLLSKYKS